MTTQRKYIIGYTDSYGEEVINRQFTHFDGAMGRLNHLKRSQPDIAWRMWEEIEVGAGA